MMVKPLLAVESPSIEISSRPAFVEPREKAPSPTMRKAPTTSHVRLNLCMGLRVLAAYHYCR
jgi:hypothetical protein